jgi:hypothetical protein
MKSRIGRAPQTAVFLVHKPSDPISRYICVDVSQSLRQPQHRKSLAGQVDNTGPYTGNTGIPIAEDS